MRVLPEVFATGFLVGLLEWASIQLVSQGTHQRAVTTRHRFDGYR